MRRKLWAGHPEAMQRKGQESDAAPERSLGVVCGLIEREEMGEGGTKQHTFGNNEDKKD